MSPPCTSIRFPTEFIKRRFCRDGLPSFHLGAALFQLRVQLLGGHAADVQRVLRELYLKGQPPLEDDLLIEHGDGVGRRNPQGIEDGFRLFLDLRLDARINLPILPY